VLVIQAVCLTLWAFLFGLILASRFITFDVLVLAGQNVDTIWLAFSLITYFLGYVAVHQPEIFKLPQPRPAEREPAGFFEDVVHPLSEPALLTEPSPVPRSLPSGKDPLSPVHKPTPIPDLTQAREKVEEYMKHRKPYTNPNLTIHELATGLKMPPHVLSKVINDGFGKNFFDFINHYRVEELKHRMDQPQYRNYTLLGLAFEVGFNSKTAFNRAFKKMTNQTPKEYFHMASDEQPLH
jgi:AraC-like DNA-binding protein